MGVFADTMLFKVGSIFVAMTGATLCMPLLNALVSHRIAWSWFVARCWALPGAAGSWGRVIGPLLAGFSLALFGYPGAWSGSLCCVPVLHGLVLPGVRSPRIAQDAADGGRRGARADGNLFEEPLVFRRLKFGPGRGTIMATTLFDLDGKIALVSGASRGIGEEIAKLAGAAGRARDCIQSQDR